MHVYMHTNVYIIYLLLGHCSGGTLAYASHCMLDSSDNNRPIAGFINICPSVRFYMVFYHDQMHKYLYCLLTWITFCASQQ